MTKEVSEYPHLKPGRVDEVAYSRVVTKFEIVRETLRSVHAIADSRREHSPLLAVGWMGELGTGVKQHRLKRNPRGWFRLGQWAGNIGRWCSSMEVGFDGV
jgi:hypothetical protein